MVLDLLGGQQVVIPLDHLAPGVPFLLSDLEDERLVWGKVLGLTWDQAMHGRIEGSSTEAS